MQKQDFSVNMNLMQKTENNTGLVEKMFEAGAHYGYSRARRHPSTSKFIYTTKNKTDIIDVEKTEEMLAKGIEFIKSLAEKNKVILFVGTKPEAQNAVKAAAEALEMPYMVERFIGGTISNFSEIKKRILELETYNKDLARGDLEKYTKKERLMLSKKMEKLTKYYGGVINLKKLPDAVFVVDAKKEHIAAREALISKIPVIALCNTDTNIKNITYPIVGNDASIPSIKFFTEMVANAYKGAVSTK